MTSLQQPEDVAADNEESLEALTQAISWSEGFTLILVRCNYASVREQMVQLLQAQCPIKIRKLVLDKSVKTLYTTIKEALGNQQPPALMILGLESVSDIDHVLASTNQVREEFRKHFSFPLILWVTDGLLRKLIRSVPDFESWATIYEFTIATDDLLDLLRQVTDEVFTKVLDAGSGKFLDNADLDLAVGSSRRSELESAQKDLQERGIRLEPELEASLEFVLGRDASSSMEQSKQHYKRSFAFWQQSDNLERRGCLLFCLGLWWRTYAVLHRDEYVQACSRAKEYYQQCIKVFEQANRPDIEAKFINALGDVLQRLQLAVTKEARLQQCNELEAVAKKALALHQRYPAPVRLAYTYGLLAEVAVVKSSWTQAQQYAETALRILVNAAYVELINESEDKDTTLNRARQYHRGWYLLLLAIAQQHLGQVPEAIKNLETARAESKPQYDPPLYIRILETLRSLYFQQSKYLEAFKIKQDKRAVEQQYGFSAFIGAGELQPQGQVVNLALAPFEQQTPVTQAIAASGRQQAVDYLIERVKRNDCVLTVLYGQSGVGKSSILNAGLIPALKQITIEGQDTLPIVLRDYTNWERDLGSQLAEALEEIQGIKLSNPLDSEAAIIEQLRKNKEFNLRTVLIFDQFAQLFFVKNRDQRKVFWDFLRDCANTSSVRVLLAMREDYLHYLLEAERLLKGNGTKNDLLKDILGKNNRYYLGNFSPEEAKAVIKQLTERSQFSLEPELIDELVLDLAKDSGEVRPIELQVVGAQLQVEPKIQTLNQYHQLGRKAKEKLVQRFLKEVVEDCGPQNENIARIVLYLLTDKKVDRPLRTRSELIAEANKEFSDDFSNKEAELDLVLQIFVKSGLVLLLKEVHSDRFQLVHDYLISFILDQTDEGLLAKYRTEKRQRERAEKNIKRIQTLAFGGLILTILVGVVAFLRQAEISEVKAITTSSETFFAANQEFNALKEGLRAGRQLQSIKWPGIDTKNQVVTALQQAVYGAKERNQLNGHNDTVFSVSFSSDGKTIASASGDTTVKLWNPDGSLFTNLEGHKDKVINVIFSPDGQTLASASHDNTVKLWKPNGTLLTTLKGHKGQVLDVSFSPDGKTIASASADKTVKLWKTNDGTLINTLIGHSAVVGHVVFSKDGQMLASASADKTVKLWNRDGTLIKTLPGHNTAVLDVSFSPDGKMLASASADETVNLWKRDGTLLKTLIGHEERVHQVSFSPDSQILASASGDNTVKLWNRDGTLIKTLTGHGDAVYRVSFSPNGQMLASGSRDNTVKLWKRDGTLLTTLKGHRDAVIGIGFSPKDQMLASASYDKTVKLWKLNNELLTILQGHSDWVSGVSFSPDGQTVASTSRDNTVKLWKRDGTLLNTLKGHKDWVVGVDFSLDGQMLASASWDKTVKLWKRDGTLLNTLKGHQGKVSDVSFSPDGQTLASASYDKTIKLWQRDGKLFKTLTGHKEGVVGVDFSPNGQMLASASDDKTVMLWRIDGTLPKTLKGHSDQVYGVNFSPDGQMLASASKDNTVKLWKLDGTLLDSLEHGVAVYRVKFSPNGKMLASTSEDNTVKLWNRDGTLLTTLKGHTDPVFGTSFSPDGHTLASASNDQTVILWNSINSLNNQSVANFLAYGCNWLDDYLKNNSEVNEKDRHLCDS